MRRYSIFLLLVSFASQSATTFNQALIEAGDAIERCNNEMTANVEPFPVNDWFKGLSKLDKRLVIGYISLSNSEQCTSQEMEALRGLSNQLTPQQREALESSSISEPFEFSGDISHLDMNEIKRMQKAFPKPFDTFRVLDELGLWD